MQDLGTFNTTSSYNQYGYSIAYSINNLGETVGLATDNDWNFKPFIHDLTNGMQQLQIDPAFPNGEWYAVAINDGGLIGGSVIISDTETFPYYWQNKSTAPTAITMPTAFPNAEIYSVNAAGQMVGIMWSSDPTPVEHAFIFDEIFGVRDLNDLIDPADNWVLTFARKINDHGQIVGSGTLNDNTRGFMLDSLNLTTAGDLTNDGIIDLKDAMTALHVTAGLTTLPVNLYADTNADSLIGLADAIHILTIVAD